MSVTHCYHCCHTVHARWNKEIVDALVKKTYSVLKDKHVNHINLIKVAGAFELPYACQQAANSGHYHAIIAVGVLVKGETMHFEYIADAVAKAIMKVGLKTNVPVIFGVLTCLSEEQAMKRAGFHGGHNHGEDWALTAIEMATLQI